MANYNTQKHEPSQQNIASDQNKSARSMQNCSNLFDQMQNTCEVLAFDEETPGQPADVSIDLNDFNLYN